MQPGCVWLQVFAIFLSCYIAYDQLTKKAHIHWFQVSTDCPSVSAAIVFWSAH